MQFLIGVRRKTLTTNRTPACRNQRAKRESPPGNGYCIDNSRPEETGGDRIAISQLFAKSK